MSKLLEYMQNANHPADVYIEKASDDSSADDSSSSEGSGFLSGLRNFLEHPFQGSGTVIAPNYTPRPLDDSVYSDIPGTPVASGQFGDIEDESVRDERMKESADYMAANWPRLYGTVVAADEGLANVVGGIQNAVGGGNGILTNVQRAEEGMQNYRDQWNNEYGDSYFLNPNKFATDVGSGIGSTVPIMALSALMPGAAVAGGTRALTSALSRAGLGRLAMSKAGQALIADTVRSPISSLADSLSEFGTVVNDMMQDGMSEDEARRRAIPMFFKNMALDTFTVPLELGVMKGGKGIATSLLGRSAGEGVAKSIAKGASRTGMLAGASGLTEGYQEGAQNALENDVEGNRDGGWYNPFTWTNEDWEAARGGFVGGALMGVPGNVAAGFHPEARQAPLSAESQEQAQSIKDTLSHGKPAGMSNAAYNAYIELANSGNPDLIKQAASSLESFQQSQEGSQESTDDAATEAYKDYETYDQKQEIENFLNNNTVEQIGGEGNFNWLMGVLRNGTPEEVQHAYDTVIAAEKATAEQEAKNRPVSGGGSMSPNTGNAMANIVIQAANDSGVEPRLGLAIAARESGGDDVNALSMPEPHDGIYGIMQAQEETVSELGLDSQYPDWKTDPYQNAMVGMAILKSKIANENGDVWAGVRDYNGAGEEAEQYRQLVKNNYDNMGDIGGGGNSWSAGVTGYDLPTQSDDIAAQVETLKPGWKQALPAIGGILNQMGLADGAAISSGGRTTAHNAEVGGAEHSYHINDDERGGGDAVDIVLPEGTTEEQAQAVLERFKETGAFKEVLFHDAGSGYHLHLGGYTGGLSSGGVSSKVTSDNGQFERELDQAAQEAKSDMDKIQAQSDQAMNEIMNDDSAEKTAQDAQQDAENAQKQAEESQQSAQDDVVPDVAQTIRDTSNNIDEINTLDGMFTKDSNGNDKFIDTPENRDFIKTNYKDEIAKAVNDAMSKKKAPSATPVPKAQQQTPHARLGRILSTYDRKDPKFKEYMNTFRNGTEQEQKKLADDLQTTQELERANSLKGNPLTTQQDQNTPQNAPQQAVEATKQPEQINTTVQVKESLETQKKRKIYLAKKQKLMERVPAGKTVKVHASTNDAGFDATYKIVPAGDITASHDMNYAVNDLYPAEYQPRDRNRPQMRGQVEKMTKGMKPELLAESQFVNEGAPVVNNSGVVLNGNGRVMAVQKAYKGLTDAHKKSAKAYKDYLVSIAPSLGIAPEKVQSMDHPVLVRQAADDADTSAIINSTEPAGSGRVHQQEAGRVQSQEKEGNEVDEKSKQSDHVDTEPQQTESKDKESTHAEESSQGDVQAKQDVNDATLSIGGKIFQLIERRKPRRYDKKAILHYLKSVYITPYEENGAYYIDIDNFEIEKTIKVSKKDYDYAVKYTKDGKWVGSYYQRQDNKEIKKAAPKDNVQEEVSKFHNVLDDEKSTPKQVIDAYKSVVDKVIANANGSRKNAQIGDKIVTDEYQSLTNSKHWGAFMNEDGGRNWHEVATINADAHKTLRAIIKTAGKETAPKAEQSKETKPAEQPKEKAGFTDDEIKTLTDRGFNRWTKKLSNGKVMDRLYIKPEYLGLELTRYKSGNISSAKFNGEAISNSEARRIEGTKCYVDVATKEVVCDRDDLKQVAQEVVDDALSKEKSQVLAQAETKKAAPKDDVKTIKKSLLNLATKVWQNPRAQGKVTFYPSQKLKDKVKELFGHDIDTVFITADDIRHIKSGHSEHEENRGQINLSEQDIPDIYDVVNDFDNATKLQSDAKGNQKIMFVKDVNGKMISLLIERGKHKAQVKTAYKKQVQMSDVTSPEPNVLNDSVPASTSIISQKAEKGNKPDELRNQLSNGGKQAYDYAFDKLSQGHEKVAQSAKESAFIYARMAERWSEIMHEYGNKTYSPEDYTKSHPIVMGQQSGNAQLERAFEQRAWHGSSHDFDKFDLGYIGTGEGAQAHGWGLYFAGNKDISQGYANKLSNPVGEVNVAGIIYSIGRGGGSWRVRNIATGELISKMKIVKAISALYTEQGKDKALKYLKDKADQTRKFKKIWIDAYDWLKNQEVDDSQWHNGKLYEVEIPDIDTLLDEQKSLSEQPSKVKKAILDYYRSRPDEYIAPEDETLTGNNKTGKEFLKDVIFQLRREGSHTPERDASLLLNSFGINGITYYGNRDGRCYVVFDDKAIQIIDKYNQDVHNAKAAYDASTGAIRLFDIADQSPFIHESAHMFLSDMERLAQKKDAPAGLVSDLQTVKDWAGYKPGQMNGYKGTALEKEFQEYADTIREAKKTGDVVAIKSAEARWIHERFARGFERYIAEGKAPNESLKNVFEKFKEWMVSIYHDLKNLGKKPPKEIQDVMARMITPEVDTKYSVREANGQLTRSKEDLKAEIKEAFPNAKEIKDEGDRMTFTMPNGSHIVVDVKNEILLTDEELAQAKKDHHIDDNGNVVVEGYAQLHGKDAYMALSQGSRENTGFHEAYHLAEGAVLTDREKAAIKKAIPDAEKRADKYAEWVEARKHGRGTAWGKLFQKIKDFAAKMKKIFTGTETVNNIFRQIESGRVWERNVREQGTKQSNQPLYQAKHIVSTFADKINLNRFVNAVLTHNEKSLIMHLGKVDADEAVAIKEATGYDVSNYEHVWRSNDVRHAQKRHGIDTETASDQIGLSPEEMVDALKVISAPDKIERGSINKEGPSIRYIKADNNGQLTIVEVVRSKRKTLDIKTMWKKRAEKLHGDYALQDTSETALDATSSTTENVAHNTDNVNGEKHYSIRKPKDAADEAQEKAEQAAEDTAVTMKDILAVARKILPIYTRSKIHYNSRATYRYDEHGRAGFVPSNYTLGDIGASIALHLDHVAQLKGANVELTNDVLDELEIEQRAAKKYKQEAPKAMTPVEARREGVKEFGRIYFQDPARAKEKYPKYYDIFEKTLDGMPEEKAAVEKILELEAQRAAQNPLLLATAGLSLADDRKKPKTVKERLNTAWARFYRTMVDETDPLRQITKCIEMELGKKLADEKDPHKRAVMCNSVAEGRASMLLFADNKAANLAYLNKIYKGAIRDKVTFEDVLNTLRKVRTEDIKKAAAKDVETYFGMYLVAQRTEEIVKTHKNYVRPEGYSHENCLRIIAEAPEAIRKAAQLYWKYNRNLVNIMEAEGLISEKQAAGLRKYEKYCPMYRDMSEHRTFDDELPTITAGRGFINQSSGIKKLKGGSILAVINPIDSMVSMTTALIARCERNDVAKVMVQSAEDHPGLGRIIVKDPSLFRADASKCAFTVMIAGKKTVYRTTPELYQALQEMSTNSAAFLTNVFGKFTDALRFGATNTPSFMVRNFIKDTLSASVNARYGKFVPIVDSIRGMKALKGDADFRAKFYGQGVPMDTYIRRDIRGAKQYKNKVQKSLKRYPLGIRQLMALSRSLVHKYNDVGEALEQGTRAGAMLNALKAGASDFEAGQEARDVTVNFSRHGSFGKKVNRYVPFFNASIQGTDKVIRTFLENPKRASLATCLYIILPTIILWAINHDDDWYKELDDNTKYTNWAVHIPGTDYHWLIPKPQEVGIGFGSGVEAVLNQMLNEDPHAMKAWARQFAEVVTPGIIMTALRPVLEWRYNYSEWTGRKLVPERLSKLPPEQQYTTATSELAKLMSQFAGKYVGLSPIAIDNFFSGWFGSLGRMSANALNKPIDAIRGSSRPPEPARYWYESPFIGSFARQDGQNSVYVERFYQLAEDMEMDYKRSDSYAKNKGKKGAPIPASLKAAQTCMKTMTKINKDIRSIKDDPKMDPETKRKRIDAAYTKMRTYAKKFVTQYDK